MAGWNKTNVWGQDIYWFIHETGDQVPDELDEISIEHVGNRLCDSYVEGELNISVGDMDYRGVWKKDPLARASFELLGHLEKMLQYVMNNKTPNQFEIDQAKKLVDKLTPFANC